MPVLRPLKMKYIKKVYERLKFKFVWHRIGIRPISHRTIFWFCLYYHFHTWWHLQNILTMFELLIDIYKCFLDFFLNVIQKIALGRKGWEFNTRPSKSCYNMIVVKTILKIHTRHGYKQFKFNKFNNN